MSHDPQQPHRRSVRLKDYDYRSPGAYFVTICTINRACLFGMVEDGAMRLSEEGMVAEREWLRSAEMRRELALDEFVVMPNHVHGIVLLLDTGDGRIDGRATIAGRPPDAPTAYKDSQGRTDPQAPTGVHRTPLRPPFGGSLGAMISGFNAAVTREYRALQGDAGMLVWQRNYHEHVIRNEDDLDNIRRYARNNPAQWALDRENPERMR